MSRRSAKSQPATTRTSKPRRRSRAKAAPVQAAPVAVGEVAKMTGPELMRRFNELVPVANAAGVSWPKHHTSLFETKAGGIKMVAKLEAAIAAAQAAR